MGPRVEGGDFTVLDGAALVIGAAVAAVHVRELAGRTLTGLGWSLFWLTFAGVGLSAAGPIVLLFRRFRGRRPGYPGVGDRLWALMGAPWLLTALLRPPAAVAGARTVLSRGLSEVYTFGLWAGVAVASVLALIVVGNTWVAVPSRSPRNDEPTPWTAKVGLVLAIGWPVQCGFGLVVVPQP